MIPAFTLRTLRLRKDRGHTQGRAATSCKTLAFLRREDSKQAQWLSPPHTAVTWEPCCGFFMLAVYSERLGLELTSRFLHFLSILINNMSQFRQAGRIIICQARSLT